MQTVHVVSTGLHPTWGRPHIGDVGGGCDTPMEKDSVIKSIQHTARQSAKSPICNVDPNVNFKSAPYNRLKSRFLCLEDLQINKRLSRCYDGPTLTKLFPNGKPARESD